MGKFDEHEFSLEKLKTLRLKDYQIMTVNLALARTNELVLAVGDYIGIAALTGSCTMRINEVGFDAANLAIIDEIKMPFYRFYLTNTAQAGKTLILYIGGKSSFGVSGRRGIINAAGTEINPATEDTLALIKAKTDNLDAAISTLALETGGNLAAIKAKTDNLDIALTALRDALILPATTPVPYNVVMTSADTEYSQALPANTKKFLIHTRDGTVFRLAYVTGKVATPTAPYFTVPINKSYGEDFIKTSGTLYFGCGSAGKVIEIIAWS